MEKIPITQSFKVKFQKLYNRDEIIKEVKKELRQKGYSIIKTSRQKQLQYYEKFSKKYILNEKPQRLIQVFKDILLGYTLSLYFNFNYNLLHAIRVTFLVNIIPITLSFRKLRTNRKKINKNYKILKSIPGVKDPYILITKKYILINNHFYRSTKGDFANSKFPLKRIFELGNYYYKESYRGELKKLKWRLKRSSSTSGRVQSLASKLYILEQYFEKINTLETEIKSELIDIKNGTFDFTLAQNKILDLQDAISSALTLKETVINLIKELYFEKYINLKQFNRYFQNKLIFSLKSLKFILEKHVYLINYLQKNNNIDLDYTYMANIRLGMNKKTLKGQIQLLESSISNLYTS